MYKVLMLRSKKKWGGRADGDSVLQQPAVEFRRPDEHTSHTQDGRGLQG